MTDKEKIIIDGKYIKCPCYIDRPLHRYDKGCLIQSQAFKEQQTEKKPILRCDEIKNCPIKENFIQRQRKEQECDELKSGKDFYLQKIETLENKCEELKTQIKTYSKMLKNPLFKIALTDVRTGEREVWRNLGNKAQRYEQALDDILEFIDREDWSILEYVEKGIKEIINKAKDGKDEQL